MNRIVNTLTALVAFMVLLIGAGAFTLSYDALYATGIANGMPTSKAWIWPLLIDTPLVVFTLALLTFQLLRESIRLWAGLVILFTLATIVFNLSHAQNTWLGWTVATVAPVGLLLTTEALRHLARTIIDRKAANQSLSELSRELVILTGKRDSLTGELDTLRAEVVTIAGQIEQAKAALVTAQAGQIGEMSRNVTELNEARQTKVNERRQGVLSLLSEGLSEDDIASHYGVSVRTIRRDIEALNGQVGVR